MKKLAITVAAAACLAVPFSGMAQEKKNTGPFFGKHASGKWMVGIKPVEVSSVGIKRQNAESIGDNYDDATGVGLILGYHFARPIGDSGGSSSFELEVLPSIDGDIRGFGQWQADIINAHMAYRSAGKLYFKLKAGLSYSTIDLVSSGGFKTENQDDVSISLGGGLGYKLGDWGLLELEYSNTSGDNDLGILGLNGIAEF